MLYMLTHIKCVREPDMLVQNQASSEPYQFTGHSVTENKVIIRNMIYFEI